jgi:hypothetical protein
VSVDGLCYEFGLSSLSWVDVLLYELSSSNYVCDSCMLGSDVGGVESGVALTLADRFGNLETWSSPV